MAVSFAIGSSYEYNRFAVGLNIGYSFSYYDFEAYTKSRDGSNFEFGTTITYNDLILPIYINYVFLIRPKVRYYFIFGYCNRFSIKKSPTIKPSDFYTMSNYEIYENLMAADQHANYRSNLIYGLGIENGFLDILTVGFKVEQPLQQSYYLRATTISLFLEIKMTLIKKVKYTDVYIHE
ncbi:hypothetical protein ACFLRY_01985 [Bacteroidota bacterium]